jgi:hypothetical protein
MARGDSGWIQVPSDAAADKHNGGPPRAEATALPRVGDDPLVNMSVWKDVVSLRQLHAPLGAC